MAQRKTGAARWVFRAEQALADRRLRVRRPGELPPPAPREAGDASAPLICHAVFDEVCRRYRGEPSFQQTVNRYLDDFERSLRDTEQQDQSGRLLASHLVSDMGRVYLFLAHASARLS